MDIRVRLGGSFMRAHPVEAALALEDVEPKELARFFTRVAADQTAAVLEYLDNEVVAACLQNMTPGSAAAIVQNLRPQTRMVTLRLMSARSRERILASLDADLAEQTRRSLRFREGSVAELMETAVRTLTGDTKSGEALQRIRRTRRDAAGSFFVLDRQHRVTGITDLHTLMRSPKDQPVSENARTQVPRVLAGTLQTDLVDHPVWAEENSVAVVDEDGVFLGAIDHRAVARARSRLLHERANDTGLETALALGELYWMGLSGVLDGFSGRSADSTHTKESADGADSGN